MNDQQPYRGGVAGGDPQRYGGIPYQPPERVPYHGAAVPEPSSTGRIVWRGLLSLVLGVLGVAALVRMVMTIVAMVVLAWHPDGGPGWGSLWGSLVVSAFVAALLLFWPVANLVAAVRARRDSFPA